MISIELSPTAKARALNRLRDYLPLLEARFEPQQLAYLDATLAMLAKAQHRVVVFRYKGQEGHRDRFDIGYEGGPLLPVETTLRGVWAVWWALDNAGSSSALRASDLAAPEADEPDQSVRRMIKRTAAAQFARWGFPELEAAATACTIRDGAVICERAVHAPRVLTR